jgi:BirA family transcriptional regulator, biotin operon repressor / biotin---[acetyl-CoA-carboxylase] ligase
VTGTALLSWEGLSTDALARACGASRVELLAETDSTLDVAHALAATGAPAGTVVVADAQRAGRGRQGRPWSSVAGMGVWCTVIERPVRADVLDLLSLRVGLYLAESLDDLAGETVRVKWPNDLAVRRGKLAGILTESRWSGPTVSWVAVGVGVNVVAPPEVTRAAGLPTGVTRVEVLRSVVRAVRSAAVQGLALSADEMRRYAARDALAGREILAPAAGRVAGITEAGALVIETPSGGREEHRAGTVRFPEES